MNRNAKSDPCESEPADRDEYFRCVRAEDRWTFEVALVTWLSPYEPSLVWKPFRTWKREPDADRLLTAREAATKRYFRICSRCHELCNLGDMHDRSICQGCAVRFLGLVY